MMTLAYLIAGGMGVYLLGSGAYYHVHREMLQADPVLISACYLFGALAVAACLV